jgi:hypothetical protein
MLEGDTYMTVEGFAPTKAVKGGNKRRTNRLIAKSLFKFYALPSPLNCITSEKAI